MMISTPRLFGLPVLLAVAALLGSPAAAQQSASPARPALKDLDGHFPFTVPESLEQWNDRAEQLRLQVRVALGIHPMPAISTEMPTIHGRIEKDGYTIEKMYFESLPGLFVSGSLYRPLGVAAPQQGFPAVMYAHGHWADGRFYQAGPQEVRQLLASGGERFENAAINHMQAACVQLARMGCVVLQYDMMGYADSQQISFDRVHGYGRGNIVNPAEASDDWLLFSAKAEGYNQSVMGLQTINSLRAFEALGSLPDVDERQIAITGASGGGTQSFITSAVEPRLAGAFPAVMVSTSMQGGCTCENACGLRVGTGNVEIAALTAPRPLGMTTAKDWTIDMPQDGFPQLQQLYGLFGHKKSVELFPGPQFPHNYNHVTRVGLYGWINRLFALGLAEPILERDFELVPPEQLSVWGESHPQPPRGLDFEKQLTAQWADAIDQSLQVASADDAEDKAEKVKLLREGWSTITAPAAALARTFSATKDDEGVSVILETDQTSAPSTAKRRGPAGEGSGKTAAAVTFVIGEAAPTAIEERARAEKHLVYTCSLNDPIGGDPDQQPLVANPRPAAAYTYGYNAPRSVRKLAALLRLIQETTETKQAVHLVVSPSDAFLAAAVALQLPGDCVKRITVLGDRSEVEEIFRSVGSITDNDFLPGSLRYQGWQGLSSVIPDDLIEYREAVAE